jgi:hypothetical protein
MKRIIASFLAFGVVGGLAAAGCGDETSGGTSGGGAQAIALDDLAAAQAKLICGAAYSCCDMAELQKFFSNFNPPPANQAECESTARPIVEGEILYGFKQGIELGRIEYDSAQAGACIAAAQGRCDLYKEIIFDELPECREVFVGKVADGGDCNDGGECAATGSLCLGEDPDNNTPGKCQQPPKEGEPCPDYTCASGLACSSSSSSCIKLVADGQPCGGDLECTSGYCDILGGVCVPKKANGEACDSPFACKDGYCDTNASVCMAKKADGQPCMSYEECVNECDGATSKCISGVCDGK